MTFRGAPSSGPGPVPRTPLGLSGLGAVGGPRGVGAGALRVIVEFLTQYDSEKVKELEAQLTRLNQLSQLSDARSSKAAKAEAADQAALTKIKQLRITLSSAEAKEIKNIRDLERTRGKDSAAAAAVQKRALAERTGLRSKDIQLLVNQDQIEERIAQRARKRAAAEKAERQRQTVIQQQQLGTERQLINLQTIRAQLVPKLGGLALGALGGIVGGAVLGVGFAAAQVIIDAVGQSLRNVIDPANKAREALKGAVAEVNKLAEAKGLTLLEAATQVLKDMGAAAKDLSPQLLADAAATQAIIDKNKQLADIVEVITHLQQLQNEALHDRIKALAAAQGVEFGLFNSGLPSGTEFQDLDKLRERLAQLPNGAAALRILDQALAQVAAESTAAAAAARDLANAQDMVAGAAQRASYMEEQFVSAVRAASNLRISGIQDQIAALSSAGPSARTQQLTQAIDNLAESQAASAYQSQLQSLAEQRSLLLLEQRIKYQGYSVDLDKLSGKYALVAIDARISLLQKAGQLEQRSLDLLNSQIDALRQADAEQDKRDQAILQGYDDRIKAIQKEGDAQDRFNRLLDLQFKLNQTIKRQSGESIEDFIQRRAQEQRQLLAEQSSLQREGQIGVIEEERDKVAAIQETANARREATIEAMELEQKRLQAAIDAAERARQLEIDALQDRREKIALQVQLEENAAQQRAVREQEGARQRAKLLAKQLADSQAADQKELESRRKALEDQIRAEQDKVNATLKWASKEERERLKIALKGARTYADAQAIIGELAGTRRALSELEAWVKANHIPMYLANSILQPLRDLIKLADAKISSILRSDYGTYDRVGGFNATATGFASGAVMELNNSSTPFGQNVRLGEEGHEIGIVLSNKVHQLLRQKLGERPALGNPTFIINRSVDTYRDKMRFRSAVREGVEDALR